MFDLINTGEEYNLLPEDASQETSEFLQESKKELKQLNLENDIESYVKDLSFDLDENGDLNITGEGTEEFFDAEKIKQSLTENTELSDAEINGIIEKWQTRLQNAVDKAEEYYAEAKDKVQKYSDKAADYAGTAGIVAFLILLLGGGAAFFGGVIGSPDYAVLVDEDREARGKATRASRK
jgi:ribosomal protein S18